MKPTSGSARGVGWDHSEHRAALLARHVDGTPCPCDSRCGRSCPCRPYRARTGYGLPMFRDPARNVDGRPLDADHGGQARALGGTKADRLMLAVCNRSTGARLGNAMKRARRTPRVPARRSREW